MISTKGFLIGLSGKKVSFSIVSALLVALFFLFFGGTVLAKSVNKSRSSNSNSGTSTKRVKGKILYIRQANFGRWKAFLANGKAAVKPGVVNGLHSPPYKKVYFVNAENKTYMVWDTSKPYLLNRIYHSPVTRCSKFKLKGTKKILGYNCRQINGLDRFGNVRVRFYFSKGLKAALSWRRGLGQTMGYPESFGVPFRIEVKQKIGSQMMWTVPYKIEKIESASFKESIFKLPSDFKRVNDVTALVFSSDGSLGKSDIEDLFEHHFKDEKRAK